MSASFEEFVELAESRLLDAGQAVADGAKVSSATCAALSAVTRSLVTLSTQYGYTSAGAPVISWQPDFAELLTAADRCFRTHAVSPVTPSSADELISDAARVLTAARDLIATHLTSPDSTRDFARTQAGAELQGTAVREHIVHRAAEVADHLGTLTRTVAAADGLLREKPHLADAYRPRDRGLVEAALALTQAAAHAPQPRDTYLDLIPAPVLGTVSYPQPQEDLTTAADEARSSLEQLATAAYRAANSLRTIENPPAHTASELRESATSLAVAHVLAADLLTRLAPHLPAYPGLNLGDSADRLRAAGAAWLRLRHSWQHIASVPDSGPRSPLTVQAQSIAVRLGRLLYADPTWNPQDGPGHPRPLGELLDPRVLDALCSTVGALPRCTAIIGANHDRLITTGNLDLYSSDRVHRPEGYGRPYYPLQPSQRAELTTGYQKAARASRNAAPSLAPLSRGYQALKSIILTRAPRPVSNNALRQTHPIGYAPAPLAPVRSVTPNL
jgi:hypothetical protein